MYSQYTYLSYFSLFCNPVLGCELELFLLLSFFSFLLSVICQPSLATSRNCRFLTSFSSRYLGIARKRSLRSERCSVEKSGTKTDAASESRAGLHAMASGEEETEGKLLRQHTLRLRLRSPQVVGGGSFRGASCELKLRRAQKESPPKHQG